MCVTYNNATDYADARMVRPASLPPGSGNGICDLPTPDDAEKEDYYNPPPISLVYM